MIAITIGAITLPNNSPILIQILLKGVKIFEFIIPRNKNINEIIIDHHLRSSLLNIGHIPITRKTRKNNIPKVRFEFFCYCTLKFL